MQFRDKELHRVVCFVEGREIETQEISEDIIETTEIKEQIQLVTTQQNEITNNLNIHTLLPVATNNQIKENYAIDINSRINYQESSVDIRSEERRVGKEC